MDLDLEGGEEMSDSAETTEVVTKAGYDALSQKLDDILGKLSAAEEVAVNAEPEVEAAATETSDQNIAPEGEVEIVDDEETIQQSTPQEEVPMEGGEEEVVSEDDEIEIDDIINELMGEISLDENEDELDFEFEEDEDSLEEIIGLGHSVQRAFGHDRDRNADRHRSPVSNLHINENAAQQEAKLAELLKENESLKESLKEYKESFKVLRKQINEVQTFNAKLAYVNKLFSKGGLTNDEKVQIAESFDNVETIEEAKNLYNKTINESINLSEGKTEQLKSKLKSKNPAVVSTKTEALYESTEVSRMKQLAGIRTLKN
jgi:Tfp pilus assembly protein PilO